MKRTLSSDELEKIVLSMDFSTSEKTRSADERQVPPRSRMKTQELPTQSFYLPVKAESVALTVKDEIESIMLQYLTK